MRKHVIDPVIAGTEGVSKNIVAIYKNWVPGIDLEFGHFVLLVFTIYAITVRNSLRPLHLAVGPKI